MAGACPMGRFCNTMTMLCEPVRSNGAACSEAIACTTDNCIDGVCCNDACADTCERCNLRGSEGTCLAIAAGTDPDNECDGTCDGAGGCIGGTPDAGPAEPDAGTALADGGPTPVVDGGSVDRDAGTAVTRPRSDDAGCGCTVPGASHGTRGVGAVLVAAIVLGVRRRRKRRRPTASARPDTSPLW